MESTKKPNTVVDKDEAFSRLEDAEVFMESGKKFKNVMDKDDAFSQLKEALEDAEAFVNRHESQVTAKGPMNKGSLMVTFTLDIKDPNDDECIFQYETEPFTLLFPSKHNCHEMIDDTKGGLLD